MNNLFILPNNIKRRRLRNFNYYFTFSLFLLKLNIKSLPIAPDPEGKIYGKYAEKYIPRSYIIGKDGKIKLVSSGYTKSGFQEIMRTLNNELKK